MWKNEDILPSSKRGSVGSFATNTELATINEKERESEQPLEQPTTSDRNRGEITPLNKQARSKIGLGSNSSLALMCKTIRKGRSYSMPFIQRGLPLHRSESAQIFINTTTSLVSGMYCIVLTVLGIAFPIAELFSSTVSSTFYQAFYVYLYTMSLLYLALVYSTLLKQGAVDNVMNEIGDNSATSGSTPLRKLSIRLSSRYGSFYLRMGAIGFGIASVLYAGLELGQYFELVNKAPCNHIMMLVTPAIRMVFIVIQLQFIFISDKQKTLSDFRTVSKFGLMHMIATNLCIWLSVLIQETRHDIMGYFGNASSVAVRTPIHLPTRVQPPVNISFNNQINLPLSTLERYLTLRPQELLECRKANIMRQLVNSASPFLYPCTIEYSLICTVILYALWNNVCGKNHMLRHNNSAYGNKSPKPVIGYTSQHFTVDCANAHKGLFASILVLVLTIISLIMFLVLIKEKEYRRTAEFQVNLWELILYILSTSSTLLAMYEIRKLKYETNRHLELDTVLLVMAQTGLYVYFAFSLLAGYLTKQIVKQPNVFLSSLFGMIQSSLQTLFIVDAWWRRCITPETARNKPGRQLVTFLLLSNIAMWAINHLENARSDFHPMELEFYGVCTWTIVTHISMPLAVFYRFHSTVCFCEIWKSAYKYRH